MAAARYAPLALPVTAVAGVAWLAGAAATGSRYPGLSLAWLLPAALGACLAAGAIAGAAALARWSRLDVPRETTRAALPLLASWLVVGLILVSPGANHLFANWVRLRSGALIAVGALCVAGTWLLLLRALESRSRALTRVARRAGVPALVFGGAFAVLLASGGGHLYTPDEWTTYGAAAGLVEHGVPAAYADEPYPLHLLGGLAPAAERARRVYPKYGILPSILAAPAYAIARLTGPGPDLPDAPFPYENRALPLVPLLVNPLLTAATAALLYGVVRELRYGRPAALVVTLSYLFGSLAWPYSKTLLSMTPAGLGLLGAFWCAVQARAAAPVSPARTTRWIAGAGLCAGLAAAARYEALLFALPITLWCGAIAWRGGQGVARVSPAGAGRLIGGLLAFGAGALVVVLPLVLGMNVLRTGNALDAGYGAEGTLASLLGKPWYGWLGILLSPGCGLVPHTPLMALGLVGLAWLWEDDPAPALVAGAAGLGAIVYYGSLSTTWCAFATWGPRYFVALAPLMALPLAALWERLPSGRRNPFVVLIGGGLAAWSAGTNLLAVLIDFNRGWQDHWSLGVTYLETSWVPFFSGFTAHVRLLRAWLLDGQGGLDLFLLYGAGPAGVALLGALLAAGSGAFVAAWLGTPESRPEPAVPFGRARRPAVDESATRARPATPSRPTPVAAAPSRSD